MMNNKDKAKDLHILKPPSVTTGRVSQFLVGNKMVDLSKAQGF